MIKKSIPSPLKVHASTLLRIEDKLDTLIADSTESRRRTALTGALAGSLSGAIAGWLAAFSLDVLKTILE